MATLVLLWAVVFVAMYFAYQCGELRQMVKDLRARLRQKK